MAIAKNICDDFRIICTIGVGKTLTTEVVVDIPFRLAFPLVQNQERQMVLKQVRVIRITFPQLKNVCE